MPADNELDPLDRWLDQQVRPLPPPPGTFELISKRARRRKLRRTAVSVASAAAVAAAVAVAVPVGLSLRVTPPSTGAHLAAGNSAAVHGGSPSTLGTGTRVVTPGATPTAASPGASGTTTAGPNTPGYLPPDFQPYSVTWDSLSTGWIMGPAGTPGHCGANQDSTICTSIARTSDAGATWQGLPAPPVGGPEALTGVTGLRFLNASYGWAFGPELWATDNGGESWHQVDTGSYSVTDLETIDGRAYALFGQCDAVSPGGGDKIANCYSYKLEAAVAGSDAWTPVAGIPALATPAAAQHASAASLQLAGATAATPATGYLVAPDGTLYEGPLDGSAWHRVATLPCAPESAELDGLPQHAILTTDGIAPGGQTRLALVCVSSTQATSVVYLSSDNGASWTEQASLGPVSASVIGLAQSLTSLPDGTLILATEPGGTATGGIYLLPLGASRWQAAALSDPSASDPSAATYGFTYVGMTGPLQGVALSNDPGLHEIWMTTDGGQTWQARPIQS
jgi:hypothetical protein